MSSAKGYEKFNEETGERFTWSQGESLTELSDVERIKQIKDNYGKATARAKSSQPNRRLIEILGEALNDEDDEEPCLICEL